MKYSIQNRLVPEMEPVFLHIYPKIYTLMSNIFCVLAEVIEESGRGEYNKNAIVSSHINYAYICARYEESIKNGYPVNISKT